MTKADLVLRISAHRNLDATVRTFQSIDIPVWERLLRSDPDTFVDLASYAYQKRQTMKTGRKVGEEELSEFLREFVWKFYLVENRELDCIPNHLTDLPLFEFSGEEINYLI